MAFAFLDIEASSLGPDSYPIEIAWIGEDGTGESHLIRPESRWTDWSAESEAVHGIARAELEAEGKPATWVASRVVAALAGQRVVTDAPPWDQAWLAELLVAGGLSSRAIVVGDVQQAYGEACRPLMGLGLPDSEVLVLARRIGAVAEEEVASVARRTHRAQADAEVLWLTWRKVGEGVAAKVKEVRG